MYKAYEISRFFEIIINKQERQISDINQCFIRFNN